VEAIALMTTTIAAKVVSLSMDTRQICPH